MPGGPVMPGCQPAVAQLPTSVHGLGQHLAEAPAGHCREGAVQLSL